VLLTLGGHKEASSKSLTIEPYKTPQARHEAAEKGDSASTSNVAPSFNPIVEFFKLLEKSYQGALVDKLKSLQDFQR
jgi:hypothetical protein